MKRKFQSASCVATLFSLVIACAVVAGCDEASANGDAGAAMSGAAAETKSSSSTSPSAPPFHGTFWADVNGQRVVLRLEQSGSNVSGKVDAATLNGKVDGSAARGEVRDPQSPQLAATFEMTRSADKLDLTLTLRDPQSGETAVVPTITLARGEPPRVNVELDRNAIGRWRHTWTQVSGDFSVAIDLSMLLNPDGTFEYGDSKMAGGGADSSFVGERGDVERGHWRAEAGVLYASQDNGATWHRHAKYYVERDSMMLTYDNGKRQIWERQ